MTTSIPQGTLLDVLKKKMRQTKEEMEKYKDECEEYHKRLQLEVVRREEVSREKSNTWKTKNINKIENAPKIQEKIICKCYHCSDIKFVRSFVRC